MKRQYHSIISCQFHNIVTIKFDFKRTIEIINIQLSFKFFHHLFLGFRIVQKQLDQGVNTFITRAYIIYRTLHLIRIKLQIHKSH